MKNGAKIIFIGNYKGGVGKTTTTLNLALNFSTYVRDKDNKLKVLVLDLDPQSSLSELLIQENDLNQKNIELRNFDNKKTINYVYNLYIKKIQNYNTLNLHFSNIASKYIKDSSEFDFIPSSIFYRSMNGNNLPLDDLLLEMKNSIEYYSILPLFLDEYLKENQYDYVFIDCPPTNNIITMSTFLIADYYLIPTVCDGLSRYGVMHYIEKINSIYDEICIKSKDADLAYNIFGDRPKLIGIFYNLIRGIVNYQEEKSKMISMIKNNLKMDINFLDIDINNYIDIARSTTSGKVSYHNDFVNLSQKVYNLIK